ncbi:MAG: glycosyltransferase family A protein [Candidatus Moranbacteria bacterium]|nr:glycosyltransferase family A protein [Candidatus Moranbacteria bacterium]
MKISVLIPVYNAGKYVEDAVDSALKQEEVEEIILVEDGSHDNSLAICKRIAKENGKVKLFQHPRGKNRGAGATRNLCIKKATQEYVAFLDADDFYLKNRFERTKEVFKNNSEVDGVYEAIGVHLENERGKELWQERRGRALTTVSEVVEPENLFLFLVLAGKGHFSLDGLTVKKEVLDKERIWFNENLEISQDTHFCLRLSLLKNLYPGSIDEPIAKRRVHGENRITKVNSKKMIGYQNFLWQSLKDQFKNKKIGFSNKAIISFMDYYYNKLEKISKNKNEVNANLYYFPLLIIFSLKRPFKGVSVFYNTSKYLIKRF